MARKHHPTSKLRPPLKWAGSKFQILDHLRTHLPTGNRLIEPFAGSGVVSLNTRYPEYILNDANQDLIGLYRALQTGGRDFVEYAEGFFVPENNAQDAYIELRADFNGTADPSRKAALFLYINRHGYNGLCRYNSLGLCNVPFGKYDKPRFPKEELLRFAEHLNHTQLLNQDFANIMQAAQPGDIVYCDPPYVPLSDTAKFTTYSAGGFDTNSQARLAELAESLSGRGVTVLISNHLTPYTNRLYNKARKYRFDVHRSISCNGAGRGKTKEVLAIYKARRLARAIQK